MCVGLYLCLERGMKVLACLSEGWRVSSSKCSHGRLGCRCPELSTLHLHVELKCPGQWAGAARPGCLLFLLGLPSVTWAEGQGALLGLWCCKQLQQGQARTAVAVFVASCLAKGCKQLRESGGFQSWPNFISMRCYAGTARLLAWQGRWSCHSPRLLSILYPPGFPFVGTQTEESSVSPGSDSSQSTQLWQGAGHQAQQDPGARVSSHECCWSDKAYETKM